MSIEYINPDNLHVNPAFTQTVRVPAGADLIYVGGQNGIDASGNLVAPELGGQTRQALINLEECLTAAGAATDDVVKWTVLLRDGSSLEEGFAAFQEMGGNRSQPPAITVAFVSGFAIPDALVEIEAVAAVTASS